MKGGDDKGGLLSLGKKKGRARPFPAVKEKWKNPENVRTLPEKDENSYLGENTKEGRKRQKRKKKRPPCKETTDMISWGVEFQKENIAQRSGEKNSAK